MTLVMKDCTFSPKAWGQKSPQICQHQFTSFIHSLLTPLHRCTHSFVHSFLVTDGHPCAHSLLDLVSFFLLPSQVSYLRLLTKSPCGTFNLIFFVTLRWGSFIDIFHKNNISEKMKTRTLVVGQKAHQGNLRGLSPSTVQPRNQQDIYFSACLVPDALTGAWSPL